MVCSPLQNGRDRGFKEKWLAQTRVDLGEVVVDHNELSKDELKQLDEHLKKFGFEIIDNRKSRLIEKIKNLIIDYIHYKADKNLYSISTLLTEKLHYDYNYLSSFFSETEGVTIEKYLIAQKI